MITAAGAAGLRNTDLTDANCIHKVNNEHVWPVGLLSLLTGCFPILYLFCLYSLEISQNALGIVSCFVRRTSIIRKSK